VDEQQGPNSTHAGGAAPGPDGPPATPDLSPAGAPPPAGDIPPPAPGGLPPGPPDLSSAPLDAPSAPPNLPPGVYPATFTAPGEPSAGPVTPAPKRSRRGIGILAAVGVGLVAAFVKFGIPLLIGAAASGVLGSVFGGPYGRLPSDQQQAFEQRFNAAIGSRLDGVPDAQRTGKVDAMITSGLPRLADEPLVDKIHLTVKLLTAADEATCARIARGTAAGTGDADALLKALEALDVASIGRWYDINIQAIEAEAASTPVRALDAAEAERILGDMIGAFSEAESAQLTALYGTGPATDADACGGMRALYRHIEDLPPADLAVAARYDVSP
jgi:hypothetical protein